MVNPKHIATFLLGAAAGYALFKYNSMTDEEKEKMYADLKEKANKLKDEAEKSGDKEALKRAESRLSIAVG